MNQQTLAGEVFFKGKGLHTGQNVKIKILPAPEETGIVFKRTDLPGVPEIKASALNVVNTRRCTMLGNGGAKISTVEHVLSALYALNIDNAIIESDAEELPALDGSSLPYFNTLKSAGILSQPALAKNMVISESIFSIHNDSYIIAFPYDGLRISVLTDYPDKIAGSALCDFDFKENSYEELIAPARTFAFHSEVKALLEKKLALGGSLDNALVINDDGYSSPLRVKNEPSAHKCLDLIGDISLCGFRLKAHIVAVKPGHFINTDFSRKISNIGGNF